MMRYRFDEQLELLNNELIAMGSLCEEAISITSRALANGDVSLAKKVADLEVKINQKEREVENLCLKLLLQQQPVAKDLRAISSALKMITDMERIGDQAEDIAEIIVTAHISEPEDTFHIRAMADASMKMVTDSIDAFVEKDVELAKKVIEYDDVVDNYFDEIKATLIERFSMPETNGEYTLDLLMIAKYFERIGDHAVNIAEWVAFSITGQREGVE